MGEFAEPIGKRTGSAFLDPFPLAMQRGDGAEIWDVDNHHYFDFVGEFLGGLYGHSARSSRAAIVDGLDIGVVLAAPTRVEGLLASAIAERFPSMERLRTC